MPCGTFAPKELFALGKERAWLAPKLFGPGLSGNVRVPCTWFRSDDTGGRIDSKSTLLGDFNERREVFFQITKFALQLLTRIAIAGAGIVYLGDFFPFGLFVSIIGGHWNSQTSFHQSSNSWKCPRSRSIIVLLSPDSALLFISKTLCDPRGLFGHGRSLECFPTPATVYCRIAYPFSFLCFFFCVPGGCNDELFCLIEPKKESCKWFRHRGLDWLVGGFLVFVGI